MSQVTVRYLKWVPRNVRRKHKNDPGALEAASKVYFGEPPNLIDLSEPAVKDAEPAEGKEVFELSRTALLTAAEDPQLPGAIIEFDKWSVTGAENVEAKLTKDGVEVEAEVLGFPGEVITKGNKITVSACAGTNVVATAWYYADDGSIKNLQIDAFDLVTGNYIDDNFVTVEPDPKGDITIKANEEGTVDTKVTENVVADQFIRDRDLQFFFWEVKNAKPEDAIKVNSRTLTAESGSNGIAWAYYRSPYQHDEPKGDWKAKGSIPWWEWQMFSALGSVIAAGLGAGTLYLFQAASAALKPWLVLLGASASAAIGYVLPGVARRFRRP